MSELDTWFADGRLAEDNGDLERAAELYRRVLQRDPGRADVLYQLGTLELRRNSIRLGTEMLETTARLLPASAQVANNLGIAYQMAGRYAEASAAFERALQIDPRQAATYFNLADLATRLEKYDAAVALYRQCLNLNPSESGAWLKLGELLCAHGNWAGTEECLRQVLDLGMFVAQPGKELELQCQLGLMLLRQEKLAEAAEVFEAMLQIDPHLAEVQGNLAYVYERMGKIPEALAAGRAAVAMRPHLAEAHNNLGVALRAAHQLPEARASFRKAAELSPQYALAQFNAGAVSLHLQDYPAGWAGYEWRNRTLAIAPRTFSQPAWEGAACSGKTLLLHTEQGLGDTLQFARFIALAKTRSQARIFLEGPAALQSLLATIRGLDGYVVAGETLPPFDYQLPLSSLPFQLGVGGQELAEHAPPYLQADPARRRAWRDRLETLALQAGHGRTAFKVGLAWQGNPGQMQDHVRSCPVRRLAPLVARREVAWFSVQKFTAEVSLEQRQMPAGHVIPLGDDLSDFGETAAALAELDLLITVDTSVAHLAGALGIPVWTMLCHTPDWRWLLHEPATPWYPQMRLFRQPQWGDWDAVIVKVQEALASLQAVAA